MAHNTRAASSAARADVSKGRGGRNRPQEHHGSAIAHFGHCTGEAPEATVEQRNSSGSSGMLRLEGRDAPEPQREGRFSLRSTQEHHGSAIAHFGQGTGEAPAGSSHENKPQKGSGDDGSGARREPALLPRKGLIGAPPGTGTTHFLKRESMSAPFWSALNDAKGFIAGFIAGTMGNTQSSRTPGCGASAWGPLEEPEGGGG